MVKRSRDIAIVSGVVYFVQGALGIAGIALPLYLRSLRWSIAEIATVSSIAAAPWVLKIFYGLLSDSFPLFGYRRKSYLIICSILSALGWLSLAFLPSDKTWVLFSLLTANLGFAATDVITDGLVVEHSTNLTSHVYQGIAWGSRSFGALVSGVLGGWLAAHWRPQFVFSLTALLPLLGMICVVWMRDRKIERGPFKSAMMPIKRCFKIIAQSNLKWFIAVMMAASLSSTFGMPFFFHMKETLGFNETFLGLLTSVGWGGALLGSVIYVRWLRQIPIHVTLRWAILLNSLNILSTLLILDRRSAFIFIFIGGIMGCLTLLPIMSTAARLTHQTRVEGTLFAILMSLFNLGQISFGYLGGKLFEKIGLYPLILATGVLALFGLFFVRRVDFPKPIYQRA